MKSWYFRAYKIVYSTVTCIIQLLYSKLSLIRDTVQDTSQLEKFPMVDGLLLFRKIIPIFTNLQSREALNEFRNKICSDIWKNDSNIRKFPDTLYSNGENLE